MPAIAGRPLRYFLTLTLLDARRSMSVAELVANLERAGLTTLGRPSKAVSDALRSEIRRGRVDHLERSRYRVRRVPESTQRYMRQLLATWLDEAAICGLVGDRPRLPDDPRSAASVTIQLPDEWRMRARLFNRRKSPTPGSTSQMS
jgi:hypothetical protein